MLPLALIHERLILGKVTALLPIPGGLRLRWVQLLLAGLTGSQEQEPFVDGVGTCLGVGSGQTVLAPLLTLPLHSCDTDLGQVI